MCKPPLYNEIEHSWDFRTSYGCRQKLNPTLSYHQAIPIAIGDSPFICNVYNEMFQEWRNGRYPDDYGKCFKSF